MTVQQTALKNMLRHAIGLCLAIYQLATGSEPPKWQDLLR